MNFNLQCLLSFTLCFAGMASAQKLEYQKILDKDTTAITVIITPERDDHRYLIQSSFGNSSITEEAVVRKDGSARYWSYTNASEQFTAECKLQDGVIHLNAKSKTKKVAKTLAPEKGWRQLFPYDLSTFILSSADTVEFESVALFGPGAFKLGKMVGVKLKDEKLRVGNVSYDCLNVRVGLSGIFSKFWHADYLFRKSDGRFMKGAWVEKPGAKPSLYQLVKEE